MRGLAALTAVLLLTLGLPERAGAQDSDVRTYRVTFVGKWNSSSTPGGVVAGAHFTSLVGAVHNSNVTFWAEGGTATSGVEQVAELGATGPFINEYNAVPAAHKRDLIHEAGGTSATGTRNFTITVSPAHPLVTLLSMIGPSPDWFVGVSGHSLRDKQGRWKTFESIDLYAWDAGTEDGAGFSLSNPSTIPQGTITSLRGKGRFSNSPMAGLTFTLQAAPAPVAALPALVVTGNDESPVTLSPAFDPDSTDYTAAVEHTVTAVTLTPTAHDGNARIAIDGARVASGTDGAPVALHVGENPIAITVSTADGASARTYTVTLTRAAPPLAPAPAADRRSLPDLALALADDTQGSIAARLEAARRPAAPGAGLTRALAAVLPGQSVGDPAHDAFDPARAESRVDSGWVTPSAPVNWQALLDNADFVLPLTRTAAGEPTPTGLDSLTLWSDGAYRHLRGHSDGLAWNGDLQGARLGAELRVTESLTAGTAVGWQRAGWDERDTDTSDRHTLTLIGVHPYAGWTGARLSAWAGGGLGWGELNSRRDDITRRENINTRTLGGGLDSRLWDTVALSVRLKAEGLLTALKTDAVRVDSHRLRLALEVDHTRRLAQAATLTPTLQLGLRRDGGDGRGGLGAELGGALRYTGGSLILHGQARTLIGRNGYKEWGIQGLAEWRARADGRGLTLRLTPGIGRADSGLAQLWTRGLREEMTPQAPQNYAARLDVNLSYGWDAPYQRGRITPYLEMQRQHTARYRSGVRWAGPGNLTLHLLGERHGDHEAGTDHALLLEGAWQF